MAWRMPSRATSRRGQCERRHESGAASAPLVASQVQRARQQVSQRVEARRGWVEDLDPAHPRVDGVWHELVEGGEVMLGKGDDATFRRPCGDVAEQLGEGR